PAPYVGDVQPQLGGGRRAGIPLDPRSAAPPPRPSEHGHRDVEWRRPLRLTAERRLRRFITGYAAEESSRAGLGIRFVSVLSKLTPATDLGAVAAAAYARRDGVDVDEAVRRLGPALAPEQVGKLIADL